MARAPTQQLSLQDPDAVLDVTKLKAADLFETQLQMYRTVEYVRELYFAKSIRRMWHFDFAFPQYRVAVEIDGTSRRCIGGQWILMGRHSTIGGMQKDNEKINSANLLGWHVLRFLTSEVSGRKPLTMTLRVLTSRGWKQYGS